MYICLDSNPKLISFNIGSMHDLYCLFSSYASYILTKTVSDIISIFNGPTGFGMFQLEELFFFLFFFPVISMFEFRHLAVVELICIPFRLTTRKKERVFTVHCISDSSQCLLPLSVGAALPAPLSTLPVARSPPQCCH